MFVTFFDVGIFITLGSPSCRLRCDQKYRVPLGYARGHGPRQTVDDLVIQMSLCTSTHVWIPKSMFLAAKREKTHTVHDRVQPSCVHDKGRRQNWYVQHYRNIRRCASKWNHVGKIRPTCAPLLRFKSIHISHPSPHEPTNCSPTHPMFRVRTPDTTIASTAPSAQGSLLRRKRRTPVLQPTSW